MILSNEIHDADLNNRERDLRDGIFNLNTRRFGKVAEYIIAKLFDYRVVEGTTNYDLTNDDNKKIEVKFSRAQIKEDEMNMDNCLEICLENANPTERQISYREVEQSNVVFNCNIEQIKANEFDELYFGVFFEEQIAIFSMTQQEVKDCMTESFLVSKKKSPKPNVNNTVEYVINNPNAKKKITDSLQKVKGKIQNIIDTDNDYADAAKQIVQENAMMEPWDRVLLDIERNGWSSSSQGERVLGFCKEYLEVCEREFRNAEKMDCSPFQHKGNNKAEGQMHIKNDNIKWYIEESGFFRGWLCYKELYDVLEP